MSVRKGPSDYLQVCKYFMLPAASTLQVQALYIRLFACTEKLHQGCGPTWSYDGGRMPRFEVTMDDTRNNRPFAVQISAKN